MVEKKTGSRSFGAFSGVFIPTFLSIVGVILFLRLGFIVGSTGIMGTIIIILLSVSVTLSTGLSLSSIASNIRIGSGGAYSIISKTLGLEVGGSVGIPLFLAQTFSVSLYIFGFAEAWMLLFPSSDFMTVLMGTFLLLFVLIVFSTKIAVKVQMAVFILTCFVIILVLTGGNLLGGEMMVPLFTNNPDFSFWSLFALFFPAVTGLMAGIGLSGELTDPKRQIPRGVILGLLSTTFIYIAVVIWFGYSASPLQLIGNKLIIVELSSLPFGVLIGILAATFSSALTTLVAAPRVLQALAENSVIPMSDFLSKKTGEGEPRNAIWITCFIVILLLFVGNLDSIAQILTMFFLITYAMINISVFIEQYLGLMSFRPTFKISKMIPLYGAIISIIMMLLINVSAGIIAVAFMISMYIMLVKKTIKRKEGDVRSGLFRAISEWAAKKTTSLPSSRHVWKPNILIPVLTTRTLFGNFPLVKSIAYPDGTMTVLGFKMRKNLRKNPEQKNITKNQIEKELKELPDLVRKFGQTGIFTSFSTIDVEDYVNSLIVSMEAIESQVFSPNILFLPFKPDKLSRSDLEKIVKASEEKKAGVAIFDRDTELGLGSEEDIHIWISPKCLEKDLYEERYYDLAMLMAYGIKKNWNGKLNLWMCVKKKDERIAKSYLKKLVYEARFPESTKINVVIGDFFRTLKDSPEGDIHIIPFEESDIAKIFKIAGTEGRSFLFVLDSTRESVLA